MSRARQILDERLARGEISADEHRALIARLSVEPEPHETSREDRKSYKELEWLGYVGIASSVLLLWLMNFTKNELIDNCRNISDNISYCGENSLYNITLLAVKFIAISVLIAGIFAIKGKFRK